MQPLAGKAVIITGAGGGLGAAYARHAAAHGASVLVNDIDGGAATVTVDAIRRAGGTAESLAGDVSRWTFAEELVSACCAHFGHLSGIVNNAGIFRSGLIADVTEFDFRRMLEINVLGTAACAQAAAKRLLTQGQGGVILNVASGSQAGDIGLGGYGATKGAVASLTYSWAMELRGTGIRVNALSPLAETAMSAQNAALMSVQAANRAVHYASLPHPDDNAPIVTYLLSDAAAAIHGQVVRIANGQLSFVTHPMIASPSATGAWTFETVADAFATQLADGQQALGLGYAEDKSRS